MSPLQQIMSHLDLSGIPAERVPATHSGIIVTLRVPPDTAAHLAVPGGEKEDELHITLAFMGKSDDLTPADVSRYEAFTRELEAMGGRTGPLSLTITGTGTFENADEAGHAHYLDVDGPGLHQLREEVMTAAEHAGLKPSRKFPTFHPHITLAYSKGPHPDPTPPRMAFRVPNVELWMGGAHYAFPLAPRATLAKADPGRAEPTGTQGARRLLAQLTGDLIGISRADRQARQQADRLAQHHAQATDRLAQAIRAPRGSAVEDAYLAHADDARAARTLAST